MKQRITTFRGKLLLALLGFVVLAEFAVAAAILDTTYDQTMAQAHKRLDVGQRVLDQLLATRGEHLLSSVNVLASDFGFKSAVATHDKPTQRTVLANFGDRVDASLAMLADPAGQLITALPHTLAGDAGQTFHKLLARARRTGSAAGLAIVGERAYQLTFAPVRAPQLIAWVGMGFQIDQALARELAGLTDLNVEFVVRKQDDELFRTGTLTATQPQTTDIDNPALVGRRAPLLTAGATQLDVILALDRAQVLAPYYALARNLALIFVITLLVSVLVAFWLARKISQPVRELSDFAESVAAGAYQDAPHTRGAGELNILADTLSKMQNAVRRRENRIRHQAMHDSLTGLPNREAMRETVKQFFDDPRRFAAIRISIRGFSRVVEALGHELSDQVFKTVADRLREAFGKHDPLGRIEGNDFLLLICGDMGDATLARDIERQRPMLEAPVEVADTTTTLALEFGVVMVPRFAQDRETLWRRTVLARDGSRTSAVKTFFYRPGMDENRMRELAIIQGLAPALKQGQLHLVFQPKMSLTDASVHQVEALARWQHPELGFIPPDEFVALAERSGQVRLLTQWLVEQLIDRITQWRETGISLGVALNLSADELADNQLTNQITPLIEAASPAQPITLEVTESALLRDPTVAMANLAALQKRGARVAVDDFGTGYSSFSQLKQLSADELKIDKSLVLKLDTTPADQSIVRMIIDLGHTLGVEVVAEGVENHASRQYLMDKGADHLQGYLLAKPMTAEVLDAWLDEHDRNRHQWCPSNTVPFKRQYS